MYSNMGGKEPWILHDPFHHAHTRTYPDIVLQSLAVFDHAIRTNREPGLTSIPFFVV
jgi:hypothetical protein